MPGLSLQSVRASRKGMQVFPTTKQRFYYLISGDDALYENDISRDGDSIRPWLSYIEHKGRSGSILEQSFILERACAQLPRSYKLWKIYLELRIGHLKGRNAAANATEYAKVNALFEKALILLNKMPRIWEMYLSFLMGQPHLTNTRRIFDRALRALPTTQHHRIWKLYQSFAKSASGATRLAIGKRYIQLHPEETEEYIDFLVAQRKYNQAVKHYVGIINNARFRSKSGKSHFQLWNDMVDLMVANPQEFGDSSDIDVESIIKHGIRRYGDQRGKLWTALATYWISRGHFEMARDAFEDGITSIMTIRDFTIIFDSYTDFEESLIGALMEQAALRSETGEMNDSLDLDLDIRMMRFEQLMDRRPFLVNDVLLRQNPNNVVEWEKRVALWGENMGEAVRTYADAMSTIQPKKATGRFSQLWLNYAKLYDVAGDLKTARVILDKAVKVPFKSVTELAEVWCGWAEIELGNENFDQAVRVMAKATDAPKRSTVDYFDESLSSQHRVHKSWKLWSFYVDLVESVSTLEDTRAIYDRIFELRIATPQTVVNYAKLLEENHYYEDSFKIYERGLDLFKYPVAFELWNLYLTRAMDREISVERLRDLFEQAVDGCPPKLVKSLYLMYGDLEEKRGLTRHAMRIYERATRAVADDDRFEMFNFYITKSAANFGLTSARPIYQRAIELLPDREAKDMCLKFAEMERRLGEIDRARAIFGHGSQFCDPRTNPTYWQKWESFEVLHGNEENFKEMLRVKRSVQAHYNTDVNFIASHALARGQLTPGDQGGLEREDNGLQADQNKEGDPMAALERQMRAPLGFVASSTGPEVGTVRSEEESAAKANPDALDISIDDDD